MAGPHVWPLPGTPAVTVVGPAIVACLDPAGRVGALHAEEHAQFRLLFDEPLRAAVLDQGLAELILTVRPDGPADFALRVGTTWVSRERPEVDH